MEAYRSSRLAFPGAKMFRVTSENFIAWVIANEPTDKKACVDTLNILFSAPVIRGLEAENVPDWVYAPIVSLSYNRVAADIKTKFWPTMNALLIAVAPREELQGILTGSLKEIITDPKTSADERQTMEMILQMVLHPSRNEAEDRSFMADLMVGLASGLTAIGGVLGALYKLGIIGTRTAAQVTQSVVATEVGGMVALDSVGSMVIAAVGGEYAMYMLIAFRALQAYLFINYSVTANMFRGFLNLARYLRLESYIPYYRLGQDLAGVAGRFLNGVQRLSASGVRRLQQQPAGQDMQEIEMQELFEGAPANLQLGFQGEPEVIELDEVIPVPQRDIMDDIRGILQDDPDALLFAQDEDGLPIDIQRPGGGAGDDPPIVDPGDPPLEPMDDDFFQPGENPIEPPPERPPMEPFEIEEANAIARDVRVNTFEGLSREAMGNLAIGYLFVAVSLIEYFVQLGQRSRFIADLQERRKNFDYVFTPLLTMNLVQLPPPMQATFTLPKEFNRVPGNGTVSYSNMYMYGVPGIAYLQWRHKYQDAITYPTVKEGLERIGYIYRKFLSVPLLLFDQTFQPTDVIFQKLCREYNADPSIPYNHKIPSDVFYNQLAFKDKLQAFDRLVQYRLAKNKAAYNDVMEQFMTIHVIRPPGSAPEAEEPKTPGSDGFAVISSIQATTGGPLVVDRFDNTTQELSDNTRKENLFFSDYTKTWMTSPYIYDKNLGTIRPQAAGYTPTVTITFDGYYLLDSIRLFPGMNPTTSMFYKESFPQSVTVKGFDAKGAILQMGYARDLVFPQRTTIQVSGGTAVNKVRLEFGATQAPNPSGAVILGHIQCKAQDVYPERYIEPTPSEVFYAAFIDDAITDDTQIVNVPEGPDKHSVLQEMASSMDNALQHLLPDLPATPALEPKQRDAMLIGSTDFLQRKYTSATFDDAATYLDKATESFSPGTYHPYGAETLFTPKNITHVYINEQTKSTILSNQTEGKSWFVRYDPVLQLVMLGVTVSSTVLGLRVFSPATGSDQMTASPRFSKRITNIMKSVYGMGTALKMVPEHLKTLYSDFFLQDEIILPGDVAARAIVTPSYQPVKLITTSFNRFGTMLRVFLYSGFISEVFGRVQEEEAKKPLQQRRRALLATQGEEDADEEPATTTTTTTTKKAVTLVRLDAKPVTPQDMGVFHDYLEFRSVPRYSARYQEICTKYNGVPSTFLDTETAYNMLNDELIGNAIEPDKKLEIYQCFADFSDVLKNLAITTGENEDAKYQVLSSWGHEVAWPFIDVMGIIAEEGVGGIQPAEEPVAGDDSFIPHFQGIMENMKGLKLMADGGAFYVSQGVSTVVGYLSSDGFISVVTETSVYAAKVVAVGQVSKLIYHWTPRALRTMKLGVKAVAGGAATLIVQSIRAPWTYVKSLYQTIAQERQGIINHELVERIPAADVIDVLPDGPLVPGEDFEIFEPPEGDALIRPNFGPLPGRAPDFAAGGARGVPRSISQGSASALEYLRERSSNPELREKALEMLSENVKNLNRISKLQGATAAAMTGGVVYGTYKVANANATMTEAVDAALDELQNLASDGVKMAADTAQKIALGVEDKVKEYTYNVFFYGVLGLAVLGIAGSVSLRDDIIPTLNPLNYVAPTTTSRKRKRAGN